MYHEHVKYNLKHAQLEYLRRSLYLTQEQLERIEGHTPCDEAAQAETHEPFFAQREFFTLNSWYDQLSEDAFQGRVFFECLQESQFRWFTDREKMVIRTPLTRSSMPIQRSRQRTSIASARSRSPAVISMSGLGPRIARGAAVVDPSIVVSASSFISSFYGADRQVRTGVEERGRRRTMTSSSSFASRSSCTTSTTTRMRSRSLEDRVRNTSRHRVTSPEGRASWDIMCPANTSFNSGTIAREQMSDTYGRIAPAVVARSRQHSPD